MTVNKKKKKRMMNGWMKYRLTKKEKRNRNKREKNKTIHTIDNDHLLLLVNGGGG